MLRHIHVFVMQLGCALFGTNKSNKNDIYHVLSRVRAAAVPLRCSRQPSLCGVALRCCGRCESYLTTRNENYSQGAVRARERDAGREILKCINASISVAIITFGSADAGCGSSVNRASVCASQVRRVKARAPGESIIINKLINEIIRD